MRVQRSKVVSTAGPPGLLKRPKKTAPLVDPNPPVGQEHLPPPRSKWADWSTSRRRLDAAGLAELAEALLASPEPSPKERLALRRALARRLPAEARRALASLPLLHKPIPSLQDILRLLADAASLLVTADLVVPAGWSVAAKNLSASGVPGSSGDWMRLIPRADGTLAIALADLEGHDRASNEAARYLDRLLGPEWGKAPPTPN